MPEPDNDYGDDLERWVRAQNARSLLLIADDDTALAPRLSDAAAEVTRLAPAEHGRMGQRTFDVAVLLGALESLEPRSAAALLAKVRDVAARRTMALVRIGDEWPGTVSRWQRNDLLGYGFHLFGRYVEDSRPVHLYRFDLFDYKPVPDWLNARHWAHPELWGKYRW